LVTGYRELATRNRKNPLPVAHLQCVPLGFPLPVPSTKHPEFLPYDQFDFRFSICDFRFSENPAPCTQPTTDNRQLQRMPLFSCRENVRLLSSRTQGGILSPELSGVLCKVWKDTDGNCMDLCIRNFLELSKSGAATKLRFFYYGGIESTCFYPEIMESASVPGTGNWQHATGIPQLPTANNNRHLIGINDGNIFLTSKISA
jgi:hypothetical protein